jgi:hypothetical protein
LALQPSHPAWPASVHSSANPYQKLYVREKERRTEIHGHIRQVQLGNRIVHTLIVRRLCIRALGRPQIRHHIRQRVRLHHQDRAHIRVRHELRLDRVNVRLVVGDPVIRDAVLAIRRGRRAVAVREIVDDEESRVRRAGAGLVGGLDGAERVGHERGHLGGRVEPLERGNLGHGGGLCGLRAGEAGDGGGGDLGGVVAVCPLLDALFAMASAWVEGSRAEQCRGLTYGEGVA